MLVLVFFAGGPDALSALASWARLEPPGSPNTPSIEAGSCAGALCSIFRFLLEDDEAEGGARATAEGEVKGNDEVTAGKINSFCFSVDDGVDSVF